MIRFFVRNGPLLEFQLRLLVFKLIQVEEMGFFWALDCLEHAMKQDNYFIKRLN